MSTETLERLLVTIEGSSDLLRQELKKSGSEVSNWSRATEQQTSKVDAGFKSMATTLRKTLGVFGVAFSVGAVVNFTRNAIQAADAVGETAKAAGFGAERFQRLSFVFRQNGVDAQEFDAAMRSANTRLGQFITTGAGPAAKAIEKLGLAQKIASGEIRTNEQFVAAIMEALSGVASSAERAALASAIFGREIGSKMQDTLGKTTAEIEKTAAAATGIFSDDTVRKSDELGDAWERISSAAANWAKSIAVAAAHDFGRGIGITELQEDTDQERIGRLLEIQRRRQSIGLDLYEEQRKELADLQAAAAARARFRTGGTMEQEIAQRKAAGGPNDGLSEILPSDFARPAGMRTFNFAGAIDAIKDTELKEIGAVVTKMPEDLKKLSPEFNNAVTALQRYNEGLTEAQEQQKELVNTIEHGLQSAIGNALRTGRLEFKQFLRDLAIDLAASALTKGLMSVFSGGAAGGFFAGLFGGKRAAGGPVQAGKGYLVNEGRPELFWPGVSGSMVPVGGGGITINQSNVYNVSGDTDTRALAAAQAENNRRLKQEIKAEISDSRRRGRPV